MSEPIYVVLTDIQKKKQVIFNMATATFSVGEEHVEVVTGQGVKFKAEVPEMMMVMKAAEIAVMQVIKEDASSAEEASQIEEAPNVEV